MRNKILTTKEMRHFDEYTCIKKGITSLKLMEKAGGKLFDCINKNYRPNIETDSILILAGIGNNGGDALVVGECFINKGYRVNIVLVGNLSSQSKESKAVYERLTQNNISILNITTDNELFLFDKMLDKATLVVDGIFGIGLSKPVEGIFYKVIEKINFRKAFIFSIDIPSGINGDNGKKQNIAVKASLTAVIQYYKVGNLLNDAKDYQGNTKLLDIGILDKAGIGNKYLLDKDKLEELPERKHNTHKYDYGYVVTIGGNIGMTGAPLMCAYSALRTGAGLSVIGIHKNYYNIIHQIYSEIMIKPHENLDDIENLLDKADVVAFGPGLGRSESLNKEILNDLIQKKLPLVIDADGIHYLREVLFKIPKENNIVITPHIGEMALLFDTESSAIEDNPLKYIEELTGKYGIKVVLKGPVTIIADNDNIYFCDKGNPGMATAGSGDVLTGIIASLIGQGMSVIDAAKLGVYVHGTAGDMAFKELGNSLIATDIIKYLSKFKKMCIK